MKLLSVLLGTTLTLSAAEPGWISVTFHETDALFPNPGKGWMTGRPPKPESRFQYSTAYFRVNWADIEPEEGRFDWTPIDQQINAWQLRGGRVSFRIMTANAHSRGYYSSPKWLFDDGCKSFDYLAGGDDPTSGGKRIPRIEPDYADPLYLDKHRKFLSELGKRYDGNPSIEYLDIGSYGIWGEWHTTHPVSLECRKSIVDMYADAFKKTPLVMMSDDAEALAYALQRGTGVRRDGVGSTWHEKNWIGSKKYAGVAGFAEAWKKAPMVFEWYGDYKYLQSRQWSFDAAIQFMLDNHVTLINDNIGAVPPEEMPKLLKLERLSGYRFVIRDLSHPEQARRGKTLPVRMNWSNVGVGLLYRKHFLELYLLNASGAVVFAKRTDADPRSWMPGNFSLKADIDVPQNLVPGVYGIGLAIVDPAGKPAIKLAIENPETDRLYRLSQVKIR